MTKEYKEYRDTVLDAFSVPFIYQLHKAIRDNNTDELADLDEVICNVLTWLQTDKYCPKCHNEKLYCSDLPDYNYVCLECEENYYDSEV